MAKINAAIDADLINNALNATEIKTKRALIEYARHELLRHNKLHQLLKLRGKVR